MERVDAALASTDAKFVAEVAGVTAALATTRSEVDARLADAGARAAALALELQQQLQQQQTDVASQLASSQADVASQLAAGKVEVDARVSQAEARVSSQAAEVQRQLEEAKADVANQLAAAQDDVAGQLAELKAEVEARLDGVVEENKTQMADLHDQLFKQDFRLAEAEGHLAQVSQDLAARMDENAAEVGRQLHGVQQVSGCGRPLSASMRLGINAKLGLYSDRI